MPELTRHDEMSSIELAERIAARLGAPLPGPRAHRRWAHSLSYGRHSGPPPGTARHAAVLVLLVRREGEWRIPLLVRPSSMPSHADQVAFPGGMTELGESAEVCALRESHEELGIPPDLPQLVGRLTPVYIYISNFQVTPCVAIAEELPPLQPNADEVEVAFELPVRELWDETRQGEHVIHRHGVDFRTAHLEHAGHRIWGATRLILGELGVVLREALG